MIDLESGLIERRAEATIDFAGSRYVRRASVLPWLVLVAILIIIAAGIAFLVWRRLRRRNRADGTRRRQGAKLTGFRFPHR